MASDGVFSTPSDANLYRKSENKPWLTRSLINACHKKNSLYEQFISNRSIENETKYKRYRNKLTSILRACEKKYYNDLIIQNKSDIKATWRIINSVVKNKDHPQLPVEFKNSSGYKISGEKNIAHEFNKYFVNIGPNLADEIPSSEGKHVLDYMPAANPHSFFIEPTSENEVIDIVKKLKSKTSKDYNEVSMQIVKNVIETVSKPLCHVCNLSFAAGVFPDEMKIAKVLPMFKSGDNSEFNNYRPGSLLPQFSKILEKLFDHRLQSFLNNNGLLSEAQYGFREKRSTNIALLELIEEICEALDKKKCTVGVFIDLRKAFDTLDHNVLIEKLYHYGFRGKALEWLKSYLANRKQFVQVNDVRSCLLDIICGVPQGQF